jgi:hypothetical protein
MLNGELPKKLGKVIRHNADYIDTTFSMITFAMALKMM